MQDHTQLPKPTTEKPSKTIHFWRIHRDLLARGKMPPVDASGSALLNGCCRFPNHIFPDLSI